jgi:chemotaxis signal transduction protein
MNDDLVRCVIGLEQYALLREDVRSVARADRIRREPGANGRVGFLPYGSVDVPVYRLAALLNRPLAASGDDHHVVITQGHGELFGLVVDRIARSTIADGDTLQPLPSVVGAAAVRFRGLVPVGDALCLVLAPPALDPQRRFERPPAFPPTASSAAAGGAAHTAAAADLAIVFSTPALPEQARIRHAVGARRVAALVQSLPSVPLPGGPRYVAALGWWRRTVVPIVDFTGAARAGAAARYLLARCGRRFDGALVALPVGSEVALHRATADDRQIAAGVYGIGGEAVALLDLDHLIADAESEHAAHARAV